MASGAASFTVNNGSVAQTAMALIEQVEPTLFSMNGAGTGVAAATAIQVRAVNPQEQYSVAVFQCGAPGCVSVPINLGVDTPTYLTLYATGIRYRSALSNVHVAINGISVPVLYAGGLSKQYKNWDRTPEAYFLTRAERAQWQKVDTDPEAQNFILDYKAKQVFLDPPR